MADPTTAQRKMFAKMGLAMPDGSFYIRNGDVGASDLDNAIEAVGRGEDDDPASGDPIRVHIMKRAKALGLSSKIPDTWNADGSLKQDAFDEEAAAFLEHYGVKGMQWRSTAQRQAAEATATAQGQKGVQAAKKANAKGKADAHDKHLLHLAHLLRLSKAMSTAHTAHVTKLVKTGQSSKVAAANSSHAKAQGALAKLASLSIQHSDFSDGVEDLLAHFGVKGMHWGVERSRTARTDDNSKSADAARARATADTIKKHGVGAVSNADLQHLVSRQNLEKQHASLSNTQRSDGQKFLSKLVDDQVDAAQKEAGKVVAEYAAKGAVWLAKEGTKQLLGTHAGAGRHS